MKMLNTIEPASGMELVIAGWAAVTGTAIKAAENNSTLAGIFCTGYLRRMTALGCDILTREHLAVIDGYGADYIIEAGASGIYGALWKLAKDLETGFEVDGFLIPFKQETIELCEALSVDPYRLDSTGCFLIAGSDGYGITDTLRRLGINASLTGHLTAGNDKLIKFGDRVSYLTRPDLQRRDLYNA